jgi:hypothetical protein
LPELENLLRSHREHSLTLQKKTGQISPSVFHRGGDGIKVLKKA